MLCQPAAGWGRCGRCARRRGIADGAPLGASRAAARPMVFFFDVGENTATGRAGYAVYMGENSDENDVLIEW